MANSVSSIDTPNNVVVTTQEGNTINVPQTTTNVVQVSSLGPQGPRATNGLGWARYDDNQYTTSSVFTITNGQTVVIPNNGNYTDETYMNSTVDFYNPATQKVQMENVGDVYSMIITFNAKAANTNSTHMDLSLTATGATPYDRVSKSIVFAKGNDIWENFYESFHFYSDADFVTNGNQWKITADGGTVSIANIIYFIQRTFNTGV